MKRRSLLKQLAVAAAASVILPSWVTDLKKASIALKNLNISADEQELVADIADVILPKTDSPGARAVDAHLYTLMMVNDCQGKTEQEKYLKGMRSFEKEIKALTGKSFKNSNAQTRLEILEKLEKNLKASSVETKVFYELTRGYILQGYLTSQHFLTKVKKYELVPGPDFKPCAPVTKN